MYKLFLLFSHNLTKNQIKEAKTKFNIKHFIYLPPDIQNMWSQVPTDDLDKGYLLSIQNFIMSKGESGDYVLVQGEYGITYSMVSWCLDNNFIPIYSACKREYSYIKNKDGSIENKHIFKHVRFKKYSL